MHCVHACPSPLLAAHIERWHLGHDLVPHPVTRPRRKGHCIYWHIYFASEQRTTSPNLLGLLTEKKKDENLWKGKQMDVQVTLWQVCIFKCRDGIGKYKVEDEMRQLCKVCNLLFVSLYFCLSLVYSLKCACKCFCNLNKRAISEIFFFAIGT